MLSNNKKVSSNGNFTNIKEYTTKDQLYSFKFILFVTIFSFFIYLTFFSFNEMWAFYYLYRKLATTRSWIMVIGSYTC